MLSNKLDGGIELKRRNGNRLSWQICENAHEKPVVAYLILDDAKDKTNGRVRLEMEMRIVPKLNSKYWLVLVAASVFGTNTGDFLSDYLHLGHVTGLPYLALVLAAIFVFEKFSPRASIVFFWAAIIVIRTAATNIADATHDIGIYGIGAVVALFLAFLFAVRHYKHVSDTQTSAVSAPRIDAFYWVVMALAGIVGTLAGDITSAAFGFGLFTVNHIFVGSSDAFSFAWMKPGHILAMLFYGLGILILLRRVKITDLAKPYPYWILVALIRTTGTAIGDYISKTSLQLPGATMVDGAIFVSLIVWCYGVEHKNQINRSIAGNS